MRQGGDPQNEPSGYLDALKADSERLLSRDVSEALRLAELLIEKATAESRANYVALGLMAKGDALRNLGRHHDALANLEAAGDRYLTLGDEVGWARTRLGWVWSAHQTGRGLAALEAAPAAQAVLVKHEEWLRAAGLNLNTSFVAFELGQFDDATELLEDALGQYEKAAQLIPSLRADVSIRIAKAKANKGRIVALLGRFDEAIGLFEEARDGFAASGETVSAIRAERFIAAIHADRGYFTRALRVYSDAYRTVISAGLADIGVEIRFSMIDCYMRLNLHDHALSLAQEVAGQFAAAQASNETARSQLYLARALANLGQFADAMGFLDTAAETFARAGLRTEEGIATIERARLHLKKSAWQLAAETAHRAVTLFAAQRLPVRRAEAGLVEGWAQLESGRLDDALRLARSSLEAGAERRVWPITHAAHHILARAAEARDQPVLALAEYEHSIRDLERVQSTLAADLRVDFLGDKMQVFLHAIDCAAHQGHSVEAFRYLERAKSRALVDYLAVDRDVRPARAGSDSQLVAELTRLRAEHDWFYRQLNGNRVSDPATDARSDAEVQILRAAVDQREQQIGSLLHQLALEQPGLEEISGPRPSNIFDPLQMPDKTVLLEYFLRPHSGLAFVVRGSSLEMLELPIGSVELRRLMNRWDLCVHAATYALQTRQLQDAMAINARGLLQLMYSALLRPLETYLQDCERLIVIPFGAAHAVPFHALHDGQGHLLEKYEVTTCPSTSLLRLCAARRPPADAGSVAIAYSDGGRLPWVIDEARQVAQALGAAYYAEAEATRETVLERVSGQRIVHFATHAAARLDNPAFAHLQLADGQLTMADVCNLDLDGSLVTLSACETGRSGLGGGDELIGLSRGFLYAGASTLIQSLWRVGDETTANLMKRFYLDLGAGHHAAFAMRTAQRSLMEHGVPLFGWAPFQVVGSGGRVEE